MGAVPLLVVAGVARSGDKVLLTERMPGSHLEGTWEFPGGKVDLDETPEEALIREWKEELAVEIRDLRPWTFAYHRYPEKTVLILFFHVQVVGEPVPQEGQKMGWIPRSELAKLPMPAADKALIEDLMMQERNG